MEALNEQWLPVVGYEGLYSVSNLGRVRSEPRTFVQSNGKQISIKGRVLRPFVMKKGYHIYDLRKENKAYNHYGHRLVLEAFVGPAPFGHEACHNNGQRGDNRSTNLRWDTRSGNFSDKNKHGTNTRGERHPFAKLTEDQVRRIHEDARPSSQIASEYGINFGTVCAIRRGEDWRHLWR